jgi:ATP-dependent DNA helicase RecG
VQFSEVAQLFIAAFSRPSYAGSDKITDTLGITTRAVEKQIAGLRRQGRLRRVGPAKGGHWEVVK